MIALFKHLHMTFALLTLISFFVRGIWMLLGKSSMLQKRWVKIAPHIIDTVLLVSAVVLAVLMSYSPTAHPWLMAKIVALLLYIGLGLVAFKHSRPAVRLTAWLAALAVFFYIVSVAFSKDPMGFLVHLSG